MAAPIGILSIDGGGIRGIIPAVILAELEQIAGLPISSMFRLIAGTSTGGIIALALTRPDANDEKKPAFTAEQLVKMYVEKGPLLFRRNFAAAGGMAGPRFLGGALEQVLQGYLECYLLSQALNDVLITSYDLRSRDPYYFKRHEARAETRRDFKMVDVAKATAAAPMYFPPAEFGGSTPMGLIDGGLVANNPAMLAFAEARRLYGADKKLLLVSISTGQQQKSIPVKAAQKYGYIGWAQCLLDIMFDGGSDAVHHQLEWLFPNDGYHRLGAIELDNDHGDMSNVDLENIETLHAKANAYVAKKSTQNELRNVVRQLASSVGIGA